MKLREMKEDNHNFLKLKANHYNLELIKDLSNHQQVKDNKLNKLNNKYQLLLKMTIAMKN